VPVGAEEGVEVKLATGGRSCNVTAVEAEPELGGIGESVALTMRDQRPQGQTSVECMSQTNAEAPCRK